MTAWRRSTKPMGWFPRRGEVCLLDLDKERPGVIISADFLNAHSFDVCIVPISTVQHRAFSLRPQLKSGEGGLKRDSWAKCDQPTTLEKDYVVYPPLGVLSDAAITRIEAAVRIALGL